VQIAQIKIKHVARVCEIENFTCRWAEVEKLRVAEKYEK
jgi:hypothetical protein